MAANTDIPRWDLFCRVVDNFGDAGVCWRIARQLAREQGLAVRLWIDRPETLCRLLPGLKPEAARQSIDDVEVCHWRMTEAPLPGDAAVVIETFGCGLPEAYVEAMATAARPPLWIVLEYLSAEDWVDSHHGVASPHPRLPLQRWYFFPGFTAATGGLPLEQDLLARREAFDAAARAAFWRSFGFDLPGTGVLACSLFAYAHAPVADWLAALADDAEPTMVAVPDGATMPAVRAFFGSSGADGSLWRRGSLEVRALPFLPQVRYDELLWACDINLVRGEDSWVRAQWAARPLVWQPYRQDDAAEQRKLEAFMRRYREGLPPGPSAALDAFAATWNGEAGAISTAWRALRACRPQLVAHARAWADRLAVQGGLSAKLVEFARNKVK